MITARIEPFEPHGDCLFLSNGIVELTVVRASLRVLRYSFCENENMLHLPEDAAFGGHSLALLLRDGSVRTELENCGYAQTDHGARLWAGISGLDFQYELDIRLTHGSSEVQLVHSIINTGAAPCTLSLAAETDMEEGGLAVLPQSEGGRGDCPNRIISLWPNTNMADPRILWGSAHILVQQANMKPLKFGISAANGWVAYFNMDKLLLMRYPVFCREPYTDNGCSLVIHTEEEFTRISTRSPIVTLGPKERRSHSESWTLYADVSCPPVEEWPVSETLRGLV